VAEAGYNPYTTVLVTRGDYLRGNRERANAMVKAVTEGWQQYLLDPATTNELMRAANPTMDAETFAASAKAQKELIQPAESKGLGLGMMTAERWAALGQQLVELKVIDKAPAAAECFVDFAEPGGR
jgi:NitT/TauT family transport system substrate-binding protein